ncbi:MAG: molecular chaperone HtpG [Culicoidibacterales bacterium]
MEKHEFKAESKRLLDMMIHSIYSNKEIFLRELISNASDATDKMYYRSLTDEALTFEPTAYEIEVIPNVAARTLTIRDSGIGMTKAELEKNLGTIASSGSFAFKNETQAENGYDIIGQFGVGFYSAFMVAEHIEVTSRHVDSTQAYMWTSTGADGYTIETVAAAPVGTTIVLHIKPNNEEEQYDEYLEAFRLQAIIKKYSDFVRYPIQLTIPASDAETNDEIKTVNSMVPLWRKNPKEVSQADYTNFYQEKHYGYDEPLKHMHIQVDGNVSYQALLYIPTTMPFDYYSKEYEKGLELYVNGILIKEKAGELLPDYFSFVKGMVDSQNLSLNISREILQQDRQLQLIAKNIKNKIKSQLQKMLKNDRETYVKFFETFGRNLKFGLYNDFGMHRDDLQDLIIFRSSKTGEYVTFAEYLEGMHSEQSHIYYATGESVARIEQLPQFAIAQEKGYEVLYFVEEIDEFIVKVLMQYQEKPFQSIMSADFQVDETQATENETHKDLFAKLTSLLEGKVTTVRANSHLQNHPVWLTAKGDVSLEMEKTLNAMPDGGNVQAEKVLELNPTHPLFATLVNKFAQSPELLAPYANVLYNQARLLEGLPIEDPVAFANDVASLIK